ncbi:sensor histidine kinase [Streptomyces sp. NPDC003691]
MRVKGWSGRSGLHKVNIYSRGTVYTVLWFNSAAFVLMILSPVHEAAPAVTVAGVLTGTASGFVCARLMRRAMDSYLGRDTVPRKLLVTGGVLAAVNVGLGLSLVATGVVDQRDPGMAYLTAGGLVPFLSVHSLLVPNRITFLVQSAVLSVFAGLLALIGFPGPLVVSTVLTAAFLTGWMAFTTVGSVWLLKIMWELRDARDVQARLAVAEERLRFGRDLHDVLGRNLAVVALKSELAVQLARRGRAEAVDQMAEVQRIAQDSQREVREVVRGYREADLRVELEGARSVLNAAGIVCTVVADDVDRLLPAPARSALGWVVREATTNVLRHGDPRRCTISVGAIGESVVLVVENDRADAPALRPGDSGSGLAGLRERLAVVGGTLEAGPARGGRFRVTARIPAAGAGADGPGGPGGPGEVPAARTAEPGKAPEARAEKPGGAAAARAEKPGDVPAARSEGPEREPGSPAEGPGGDAVTARGKNGA